MQQVMHLSSRRVNRQGSLTRALGRHSAGWGSAGLGGKGVAIIVEATLFPPNFREMAWERAGNTAACGHPALHQVFTGLQPSASFTDHQHFETLEISARGCTFHLKKQSGLLVSPIFKAEINLVHSPFPPN